MSVQKEVNVSLKIIILVLDIELKLFYFVVGASTIQTKSR